MQRYFVKQQQINNNIVKIIGDDVHHIKTVMRMRIGEHVLVCDEIKTYLCSIDSIANDVTLSILETYQDNNELNIDVTVAHGLVRREKMEEVIRRLVELGCNSYIPVDMKRSVVKFKDINISRLEKIVKEAAEQSQRLKLMELSEVISFKQLLSKLQNYDLILFAHVGNKDQVNLFNELKDFNNKKILVIVGPEGGFDDKEVEVLESYNHLKTVSLGKRILRTETAPLFVMSVLGFLGEQYEN